MEIPVLYVVLVVGALSLRVKRVEKLPLL